PRCRRLGKSVQLASDSPMNSEWLLRMTVARFVTADHRARESLQWRKVGCGPRDLPLFGSMRGHFLREQEDDRTGTTTTATAAAHELLRAAARASGRFTLGGATIEVQSLEHRPLVSFHKVDD